jgi:putative peptidoglycan lipid II flippase
MIRAQLHEAGSGGQLSNPAAPSDSRSFTPAATWIRSASVSVATILGQAPTFFVPLAVARVLGATADTDAFFLAFALITFALNAMSGATQNALVPLLVYVTGSRSRLLLAHVQTLTVAVAIAATALLTVGARFIAPASAIFVVQLLPFAVPAALASVWTGALYAQRQYVVAALTPAVRTAGVLVVLWAVGGGWGAAALVWGYCAAEVVRLIVLGATLRPPALTWSADAEARRDFAGFIRTGGAQAAGSALIGLIPVVDRIAASNLPLGSVSLLDYAERMCQVPIGLLMSGFLVVSLAQWSHEAARGDSIALLRHKTRASSLFICAVSIVPIVLLILARHRLTAILFGGAHLSPADVRVLADTLGAYLLGVPVLLAGLIYARAFLVLRRSDWLLKVSIGQLGAKIALNAWLAPTLGLPGIAMATASVYALGSIALVCRLHVGDSLVRTDD